jgi:hypothetical protein
MGVKNELFPLKCIWLLLHCLALPRWQVILTVECTTVVFDCRGNVKSCETKRWKPNSYQGQTDEDNPEQATSLQCKGDHKDTTGHI